MNTKEAIKLINNCEYIVAWERKNIICLLKRGERFEKMWEDLRLNYGWVKYEGIPFVGNNSIAFISKIMDDIEQNISPKLDLRERLEEE